MSLPPIYLFMRNYYLLYKSNSQLIYLYDLPPYLLIYEKLLLIIQIKFTTNLSFGGS